jgi:hypothetical protein
LFRPTAHRNSAALLSTRQQGGALCPLLPLSPLLSSSSF